MKHNNNNDWFVLCTKARQELKVLERLTHLGIKAYTPTKIEVRKWSDRKKKIQTCLLPSMVLVSLHESEINQVFDVPGVKRYLFFNGVRAVVFDHEVLAEIWQHTDEIPSNEDDIIRVQDDFNR